MGGVSGREELLWTNCSPIPLHNLGEVVEKSGVKSKVHPGKMGGCFGAFWFCLSTQLYFNRQQIRFSEVESVLPMIVIGKRTL